MSLLQALLEHQGSKIPFPPRGVSSSYRVMMKDNDGVVFTPGKKEERRGRKNLDSFNLQLIGNKVKEFYIVRKEITTVMKLLKILISTEEENL
ncbi:unnamed protein product [Pieris macdunnoughi]|uniref:Uncharacterized protein n=1 Tax=Pieris macdunnoughi TaxID=345717 RepID=A0A821PPZ0_9NEOP|nr:unnamed protein product [Pieris macdunnoughi]